MPNKDLQPEMWTLGSNLSIIATGAVAALFAGFFAIGLVRHFGLGAMAFGGLGAALMIVMAWVQWRVIKQRKANRR